MNYRGSWSFIPSRWARGRELHKSFFATRTFRSCSRASTCRASAIGDRDGPDGAGDPPRSDTLTAGGPKLGSHGQATLVRDVVAKANERPRLAGRQRPPPTHLGRSASPAGSATASTGFRLCAPAQLFLAQIEETNRRPACKRVSPVRPRRCRTSSLPPGPGFCFGRARVPIKIDLGSRNRM